jgi:hypothetical protein
LPAPSGLLDFLLVFTFVLHVLAMDFLLGGVIILSVSSWFGGGGPRPREFRLRVARALPPVTAFTITLGVAPLLFLQLVYGQLFYTSSDFMAWYWLAVVLLVLLGYYGVYWYQMGQEEAGPRAARVVVATAILFLTVAFIFVQNMTSMLRPLEFYDLFRSGRVGSSFGPVTFLTVARWAHFVVAAVAVAGLGVALLSRRWVAESPDLAAWGRRYGLAWFMGGTTLQFLVGLWFLFGLPAEVRQELVAGKLSVIVLLLGVGLALLALLLVVKGLPASAAALVGAVSMMAILRHLVRVAYLRPYFSPHALPVEGQWVVFSIFVLLLLAGLATVGWMLWVFYRSAPEPRAS